jgi:iron complex outermembrane receptor protein
LYLVAAGGIAHAQDSVLNSEIIVTANRREQQLSDVGISITAFSGQQLKDLGVTSSMDVDKQTPGLIATGYAGSITVFNIRGSGQLDFNDQQEAPVAVYVDDAYVSFLSGVGFSFFDLDHIEVLRGAQGTLFGRNATAGVVHFISRKPTDTLNGYAELTLSEYGGRRAEGAIGGPIADGLNGRLSLYYDRNSGYVKNLGTVNRNGYAAENFSGRAQIAANPSDNIDINLSARWAIDNSNTEAFHIRPAYVNADGLYDTTDPQTQLAWCQANIPRGTATLGSTDCFGYTDNDPYKINNDYPTRFDRDYYDLKAHINIEVGPGTLTSITDYQNIEKNYRGDSDSTPVNLFNFFQDFSGDQFSQELRYAMKTDHINLTVGSYYLKINSSGRAGVDAIGALGVGIENRYRLKTETFAAFSQLEYNFTSVLTGILGVRWTADRKTYSFSPRCTFLPDLEGLDAATCSIFAPLVQAEAINGFKLNDNDWSGSAEINYRPNKDLLIYGKVARGYKAGGVNGGIVSFFPANELTYGTETPLTFEIGSKLAFGNGRYSLNTSFFYTDYNGFQTFTSRPGVGLVNFNNDARIYGSEIELRANPARGLDILLGLGLLDAKSLNLSGAGGTYDRKMANAPKVKANALVRYQWDGLGGKLAGQIDTNYVGKRALEAENHPALDGASYNVWNASLEWRSKDDDYGIKFWIKNLTDETYLPMSFNQVNNLGITQHVIAPPRWFGATASVRF